MRKKIVLLVLFATSPLPRKKPRENGQFRENREVGNFAKTQHFVSSNCKFPDSKIQDIAIFAGEFSIF